jgi:hypothetical protein
MESALFQQRLRASHVQFASRRLEEQEFKVLNSEKQKRSKTSRKEGGWRVYLSRLLSLSPGNKKQYSKFDRANQLWDNDEDGSAAAAEERC